MSFMTFPVVKWKKMKSAKQQIQQYITDDIMMMILQIKYVFLCESVKNYIASLK